MNLRNNNGFTAADILISVIVLTIFIPTIFGVVYNVSKTNKAVVRESRAVGIATDILETAKSTEVEDFNLEETSRFNEALGLKNYSLQENDEESALYSYEGEDGEHYIINLNLAYPYDEENELVKTLTVNIEYPIGNTTKSIEISTVLKSN